MRIYGFFNDYSGYEIDYALSKLSASEYRILDNIFESKGINFTKFKEDRSKMSSSVILKLMKILEYNRKNGITFFNKLTENIMNLVNEGKSNKEICEILNIDYSILYYELKKVRNY